MICEFKNGLWQERDTLNAQIERYENGVLNPATIGPDGLLAVAERRRAVVEELIASCVKCELCGIDSIDAMTAEGDGTIVGVDECPEATR